jgi:ABC-2 type transport system permease protein
MTIFFNSLKRLLKNKVQIIVLLILPLIPIMPICLESSHSMNTLKIGIVDSDKTGLTNLLKDELKANFSVIDIKESDINNIINTSKADFIIDIPKGYSEDIINLKNVKIKGYANKTKDASPIVRPFVDNFINPIKKVSMDSNKNSSIFYKSLKNINLKQNKNISNKTDSKDSDIAFGMIIMFVMFSSVFAATQIITDKENRTLFRTINTGVSLRSYMAQNILSFFVISIVQIVVLISIVVCGFGLSPGSSLINMFAFLSVISIVSVSLGIAITAISKNVTQAIMTGIGIVTLMSVIGGAWGMEPTSKLVKAVSNIMPITYAMDGIDKLLNNDALSANTQNIVILLAFACIFFLLGTWKKTDILS